MIDVSLGRRASVPTFLAFVLAGAAVGSGSVSASVSPTRLVASPEVGEIDPIAALRGFAAECAATPDAGVVWNALPPSYRQDVQRVVDLLCDEDVDRELLERSLALAHGWGVVLRDCGEDLLAVDREASQTESGEFPEASPRRIRALLFQVLGEGVVYVAAEAGGHDRRGAFDLEQVFGDGGAGRGRSDRAESSLARCRGSRRGNRPLG